MERAGVMNIRAAYCDSLLFFLVIVMHFVFGIISLAFVESAACRLLLCTCIAAVRLSSACSTLLGRLLFVHFLGDLV
jgi:hypothetical protein